MIGDVLGTIFEIVVDVFAFADWGEQDNKETELVFDKASEKLGSKKLASEWLETPLIGAKSPRELIEEGRATEVLSRIEGMS